MGGEVKIKNMASAGSVESNDILIMLSEGTGDIDIELDSVVKQQYGDNINRVIKETLEDCGVKSAKVIARDKGALDFTIRARVKACVARGIGDIDEL